MNSIKERTPVPAFMVQLHPFSRTEQLDYQGSSSHLLSRKNMVPGSHIAVYNRRYYNVCHNDISTISSYISYFTLYDILVCTYHWFDQSVRRLFAWTNNSIVYDLINFLKFCLVSKCHKAHKPCNFKSTTIETLAL
jgi:hypothetical protein